MQGGQPYGSPEIWILTHGGFIDVSVTNCYFYDSPMGAMKLALVDGGRLENIEISRVVMKNVGCPILIRLGNRGSTFGKGGQGPGGHLEEYPNQ